MGFSHLKCSDLEDCGIYYAKKSLQWPIFVTPWDSYESIITQGSSVKLAIEVVSTNWQDDYAIKQIAYQALGIQEYWIVDYLGLGGRNFIGYPRQPTISVYYLVDGEYDLHQFRSCEMIESPTFPDLKLSIDRMGWKNDE